MIRHKCDKCQQVKPVIELEYVHGETETHTFSGVICVSCKEKENAN